MNKIKLLIIIFLTLTEGFIFISEAYANDCPNLKFAKKYAQKASSSPIGIGQVSNGKGTHAIKIKRLSSTEYVLLGSLNPGGFDVIVTEECGKVSFEYSVVTPVTYSTGEIINTEVSYACDGFLKPNKLVSGTCIYSFLQPDLTEFSDAISFKWRPVK